MVRGQTCSKTAPDCAEAAGLWPSSRRAISPGLTIHLHAHTRRDCPAGDAQLQCDLCCAVMRRSRQRGNSDVGRRSGALEKAGLQLDAQANQRGRQAGGGVLIDVQLKRTAVIRRPPATPHNTIICKSACLIRLSLPGSVGQSALVIGMQGEAGGVRLPVEEDGVCQLGEGLHRAPIAAPEAVQGVTPATRAAPFGLPGAHGKQVDHNARPWLVPIALSRAPAAREQQVCGSAPVLCLEVHGRHCGGCCGIWDPAMAHSTLG